MQALNLILNKQETNNNSSMINVTGKYIVTNLFQKENNFQGMMFADKFKSSESITITYLLISLS